MIAVLCGPGFARAQSRADLAAYRPTAAATRVEGNEAPTIDGDVSDPVWAKAAAFDTFYQVTPDLGAKATERTVVRLLYDKDNLYVALYAYDAAPDKIVANLRGRDVRMPAEDSIRLVFDPTASGRNGYSFEVNPNGAYTDALVQNNATFTVNWNPIWTVKAVRTADGWTAEASIPFRSLTYDPRAAAWGFNVERNLKRKNEEDRWSNISVGSRPYDFSNVGMLTGIADTDKGLGLDVQVFGKAGYKHTWDPAPAHGNATASPSGNLYYKISPDATVTLTANTDFSNTPLDQRQVNLSRFGLFLPETRDFFLQDAALFEFGGLPFANNANNINIGVDQNGEAFFSRNVGRAGPDIVGILGGAKLSVAHNGIRVGALTVETNSGGSVGRQNLSVVRSSVPVGRNSQFGVIATHGDPTGLSSNTLSGGDFQYRTTVFGDRVLKADAFFQRTFSSAKGNDNAFGFAAAYPNEPLYADVEVRQIGKNFAPALGFLNQPEIRMYVGDLYYRNRYSAASPVRYVEAGTRHKLITDLNNVMQTRNDMVWLGLDTGADDLFQVKYRNRYERVNVHYFIPGGVRMPAGSYGWNEFNLHIESSTGRRIDAKLDLTCCKYFNGRDFHSDLTVDLKPNGTFSLTLQHTMDLIRLPTGRVDIHVVSFSGQVNFTNNMYLAPQIQYDNISHNLGVSLRYDWLYNPTTEFFVAVGTFAAVEGPFIKPQFHVSTTEFVIRVGHTFRL